MAMTETLVGNSPTTTDTTLPILHAIDERDLLESP